uniref:Uncharacterized protein n=1 Tax=viral metagenome TaxID=1070528 RepID=A0A6C0DS55_9ZZZZ
MADTIVDGTLFNSQNIRYSAPKANASGGKSINILNNATKGGLRIATPLMLTWGASDFEGNGKFEMSLQFPSDEYKTEDSSAFLRNLIAFEQKIKDDALTYSKDWFGKAHKSADVVDALWTPMLKYSKNKATGEFDLTKAPTLRVKITQWEGVWKCEVYDEDENKLFPNPANPCVTPLDFLQKGVNVACVLQCGGLWFANGKFGITWKLIQAVGAKQKASLSGKCLIKLKTSDKEKIKAAPEPEEDGDEPTALVEDSDAESDGEQEEVVTAPVPVPTPVVVAPPPAAVEEKPKKKVVKKKVAGSEA